MKCQYVPCTSDGTVTVRACDCPGGKAWWVCEPHASLLVDDHGWFKG